MVLLVTDSTALVLFISATLAAAHHKLVMHLSDGKLADITWAHWYMPEQPGSGVLFGVGVLGVAILQSHFRPGVHVSLQACCRKASARACCSQHPLRQLTLSTMMKAADYAFIMLLLRYAGA